jgi:hypothetical protein
MAWIIVDEAVDTNASVQLETTLKTLDEQEAHTILLALSSMERSSSLGDPADDHERHPLSLRHRKRRQND